MQILGLSDEIIGFVHSPAVREKYGQVDLIASCGDLPANYLEYVVSMLDKPLIYVPGNHDRDDYAVQGGVNLDGALTHIAGLWIAGFGGSRRYKSDGRHQYTELQMASRLLRRLPRLLLRRLVTGHGVDILLTHAPPRHIHDAEDWAHRGFVAFRGFISLIRPRLMLHGHAHIHRNLDVTESSFRGCRVINVFPNKLIELNSSGVRREA